MTAAGATRVQVSMPIVKYCAEEVERQQDGPLFVYHMIEAWLAAIRDERNQVPLSPELIMDWGRLVSPQQNARGFRIHEVRVSGHLGVYARAVPREIAELCRQIREFPVQMPEQGHYNTDVLEAALAANDWPALAYLRFELIHPFADGNGRTGKILYNWLRGSLERPALPPNFFGGRNP